MLILTAWLVIKVIVAAVNWVSNSVILLEEQLHCLLVLVLLHNPLVLIEQVPEALLACAVVLCLVVGAVGVLREQILMRIFADFND